MFSYMFSIRLYSIFFRSIFYIPDLYSSIFYFRLNFIFFVLCSALVLFTLLYSILIYVLHSSIFYIFRSIFYIPDLYSSIFYFRPYSIFSFYVLHDLNVCETFSRGDCLLAFFFVFKKIWNFT